MPTPTRRARSAGAPRAPRLLVAGALALATLASGAPAALAQDPLRYPISTADDLVQSWYVSVLGRGPANAADDVGRAPWVDALQRGSSAQEVITELTLSPEHVSDHVEATYREVLHRRADPGARYWVREVLAGRLSLDAVDRAILSSPEMVDRWGSSTTGRDRYVQDLYVAVLGRYAHASSRGERAWWVDHLARVGPERAVGDLWDTTEATNHRVDRVYRLMLRRPADSHGLRYWRGVDARGGTTAVVAGVGAAGEYLTVDWKQPYELDTGAGPYPYPYYPNHETVPRRDTPPPPTP